MFKIKEILQQIKNIDKNEVASTITSTISTVKNKIFSIFNMPKDEATDTEINKTNEEINEEEVNKWKKKVSKERKKENNSSKHNSSTNNSPIKDN
ncbi:MAG: hypothetical protein LBU14_05240 [Candidatus Peribacteria bacterium]|jgi:hypothetical protein|nr:hypothetical protein [Candidatus Peribacteria bacterium]